MPHIREGSNHPHFCKKQSKMKILLSKQHIWSISLLHRIFILFSKFYILLSNSNYHCFVNPKISLNLHEWKILWSNKLFLDTLCIIMLQFHHLHQLTSADNSWLFTFETSKRHIFLRTKMQLNWIYSVSFFCSKCVLNICVTIFKEFIRPFRTYRVDWIIFFILVANKYFRELIIWA